MQVFFFWFVLRIILPRHKQKYCALQSLKVILFFCVLSSLVPVCFKFLWVDFLLFYINFFVV